VLAKDEETARKLATETIDTRFEEFDPGVLFALREIKSVVKEDLI
jgi:hypothetical protein